MKRYEVVREIANSCERNQMRDVLFFEVDTDDPVEWVRREIKGGEVHLTAEEGRVCGERGHVSEVFVHGAVKASQNSRSQARKNQIIFLTTCASEKYFSAASVSEGRAQPAANLLAEKS